MFCLIIYSLGDIYVFYRLRLGSGVQSLGCFRIFTFSQETPKMFLRKAIKFFIPISNVYVNDTTSLHPWEDLVVLPIFILAILMCVMISHCGIFT